MAYKPTRRRGPNKPKVPLAESLPIRSDAEGSPEPTAEAAEAPAPAKRRARASVGGLKLRLAVPEREGYRRYWFNDTPGRLAEAEDLAYEHVTDPGLKSDNPGGPVRRLVGTQANGQPLHAYLMETPLEEYQRGEAEREEQHRAIDDAIAAGRDATGRVQDAYGEGSIGTR